MPKKKPKKTTIKTMVANAKQLADEFDKAFLKGGRKKSFDNYGK